MTKDIYILKLVSGAEIITNVERVSGDNLFEKVLTISKPFKFAYIGKDVDGIPQLGFTPYVMSDGMCSELTLNGNVIESYIKESHIDSNLKKEYLEKSSTIQLI